MCLLLHSQQSGKYKLEKPKQMFSRNKKSCNFLFLLPRATQKNITKILDLSVRHVESNKDFIFLHNSFELLDVIYRVDDW